MPWIVVIAAAVFLSAVVWILFTSSAGPTPAGSGLQTPGAEAQRPEPAAATLEGPLARHPAAGPERVEVEAAAAGAPRHPLASRVRGTIVDAQNRPVGGAKVVLEERVAPMVFLATEGEGDSGLRLAATTDGAGRYVFSGLPLGMDFDMWVYHPDHAPTPGIPVTGIAGEEQELQPIVLKEGLRIYGLVTDLAGNPVAARIEAALQANRFRRGTLQEQRQEDADLGRWRTVESDGSTGAYELRNLAEGVWTLTASCEGYASAQVYPVVLGGGQPQSEQNLELGTEFVIGGIVVDEARNPVPAAQINASRTRPRPSLSGEAVSDAQGLFRVRGLQDGMYGLFVRAEGYSDNRLPQVAAGKTDLEIVLVQKGGVEGRVLDDQGRPVGHFTLEVHRVAKGAPGLGTPFARFAFDDPNGNYVVSDLDPGPYVLRATVPGFAPSDSPGFHVERAVVRGVDIQLRRGGTLSGVVSSTATGGPLPGAEVVLHGRDWQEESQFTLFGGSAGDPNNVPPQTTTTDGQGRFELRNAWPGDLKVEVRHPAHLSELVTLTLAEGQHVDLGGVQLRLGGKIQGVAYDAQGQLLAGGSVYLNRIQPDGAGTFFSVSRTLDARGRFSIEGLKAGTYEVSVFPADAGFLFDPGGTQQVYVTEGKVQSVELRMPPEQ